MPLLPDIIAQNGFTFGWNEADIWPLEITPEDIPISLLTWHFELPFWNDGERPYSLSAHDVMAAPEYHAAHFARIQSADTSYPIDIAQHPDTGNWVILDGLHRLMKLHLQGAQTVRVRKIPLDMIPRT